jgi:N-acetylated-alpha-linked acidic dipeptidase
MRTFIASFVLLAGSAYALDGGPSAPLRGYTADHSAAEIAWEQKFRALPDPARVRDTMQRLSARPHHVGSPYDKDNAEWLLAQLKSYGLDAKIEMFDTLFPTPKARTLELLGPTWKSRRLLLIRRRTSTRNSCRPTMPTPRTAT